MYVIAKLLCPMSHNGRLYPSSLIKKLVEEGAFNGLPVIDGHTGSGPANKVGVVIKAVYDEQSRCAVGLIKLEDERYAKLAKEGKIAFSIEGTAGAVERVGGDLIVKDLKLEAVAVVAEPGVNAARPIAVAPDAKLVEELGLSVSGVVVVAEKAPYVGYVKPSEEEKVKEQDVTAPSYAGPVYVNVNVNVTGREETESKVQSQKGEEETEEEGGSREVRGGKFQVQRGEQRRRPMEGVEEEECVDEACKKRKKKEEAEEVPDFEACKRKKMEEEGLSEEEAEEACKPKHRKRKGQKEEIDAELEEAKKRKKKEMMAELLLTRMAEAELEDILAEVPELKEELSEEDIEFVKGVLALALGEELEEASKECDEECIKKCEELSKKYGIPCVLKNGIKPRHPECIGNPDCCDPVNGFWPIDRPGRARIAIYLMARHWARMAKRYGLKGWAKIVDCIVYKAKTKYGIDVRCASLKQRTPNIWPYLEKAKKVCVEEAEEGLNVPGVAVSEGVKVSETAVVKALPEVDPVERAFLKLTEALRSGAIIKEEILNDQSIIVPIVTKLREFTREGKLWGKLGDKFVLDKSRMIVGAPIEIPVLDYRFDTAEVIDTYPPTAPSEVSESLATVTLTVKKAQGTFSWSDDQARMYKNIGSIATRILSRLILNTLDKEIAGILYANGQAFNYDPAVFDDSAGTVSQADPAPAPNVADILDAETDLADNGYEPTTAVMPPALLSKLANTDPEIKQALAYAKKIQPGQVIELLGLKVIVGDKLVTPIKTYKYTDPTTGTTTEYKVAYMYLLDERAVVEAEADTIELAPAYYPERDKPYLLVARKYFGATAVKPDAIRKLAFVIG